MCVCSLVRALTHSLNRSCSFHSLATKIKFASSQSAFGDCSTVDLTMLYSTLFTFRIEYIFIYLQISFETNDNFSLRCTWGSSHYVRIAAFHLSQPIWELKKEEEEDKNNKITWIVCVCIFGFLFMFDRLSIYLFILCDKKLPAYETELKKIKLVFYAEDTLRIPTKSISGSKFFEEKKWFQVNVTIR